jgi:hypothetical protein
LPTGSWPAARPRRERQPAEAGPGSSGQEIASTLTEPAPQTRRSAVGRPASCLSFCLIHLRPAPFTSDRSSHVRAGHGRWRISVNGGQHCWKACWVQALASSNLASSATSDQAIHKPRSCIRPGLARLRSLICSLIHYTHICIKRPIAQAHASECYPDALPKAARRTRASAHSGRECPGRAPGPARRPNPRVCPCRIA